MQVFGTIKAHLVDKGLSLREGPVIDATIIAAPSSIKNRACERDTEMHPTKKGIEWNFGIERLRYRGLGKNTALL